MSGGAAIGLACVRVATGSDGGRGGRLGGGSMVAAGSRGGQGGLVGHGTGLRRKRSVRLSPPQGGWASPFVLPGVAAQLATVASLVSRWSGPRIRLRRLVPQSAAAALIHWRPG